MLRRPCLVALVLLGSLGCRADEPEMLPSGGDPARGFELLAELACTRCHVSPALAAEPATRLFRVGARLTPGALRAALAGGPRMPDCLAGLGEGARSEAQSALTHFLVARGGPLAPETLAFDAQRLERGRRLYHSVGCVACHEPFEEADTLQQPLWEYEEVFEPAAAREARAGTWPREPRSLSGLRTRTSFAALTQSLLDPLAVHPSGRMPSFSLEAGEAADIAAYLLYEDALTEGVVLARGPGLLLDYYEADFPGATADFDALEPMRSQVAHSFFEGIEHREDDFGFRFRGMLAVKSSGLHRFWTRSDDGSMLYIDGALVVDNRGQHGMDERTGEVFLDKGEHALEVTFFEHGGDEGLEVSWAGPGGSRRPLGTERITHLRAVLRPAWEAFEVDPQLSARGGALYARLGCAACHEPEVMLRPAAAALAELDARGGCLSTGEREGRPLYALEAGQRADLAAALRHGQPPERSAEERLQSTLARLDCGACHERGALGGPPRWRRPYFLVADGLDLGDEGRLPPTLERVGSKLQPAWLQAVLSEGGRARPYMRTRMPQYGAENVAALAALFAEADAHLRDESEPEFSVAAVAAGRELVGTKGLGCIQCHGLAGHPSLGIPAVDLAHVHERIHPGWFRELLMDPIAIKMNTRMPTFWTDGKSPVAVLGADPARQVDAMWSYLSLGSSMPLPEGLVPLENEYEVEVIERPVCVGVFMAGVSPRTLAVGLPERLHYAFDVQNSRLALAWRGRFLDARGTWFGRAGQLEEPAGEDVLEFPPGPPFALLEKPDAPWPEAEDGGRGYRVLGRSFDEERRPVFRYAMGTLEIEETPRALIQAGGASLVRRMRVVRVPVRGATAPHENAYMRVALGANLSRSADGSWALDAGRPIRISAAESAFAHLRADGRSELRVPVALARGGDEGAGSTLWGESSAALFEVEFSW